MAPYPESFDRTKVAVYCLKTGAILKVVRCALEDAHRQHAEHPEHGYIDVTGTQADPHLHAVDVGTGALVARTNANAGDKALKRHALKDAMRIAAPEADLTTLLLRAASGDEAAKAEAGERAAARQAADEKLGLLLLDVDAAATLDDLARITWA